MNASDEEPEAALDSDQDSSRAAAGGDSESASVVDSNRVLLQGALDFLAVSISSVEAPAFASVTVPPSSTSHGSGKTRRLLLQRF